MYHIYEEDATGPGDASRKRSPLCSPVSLSRVVPEIRPSPLTSLLMVPIYKKGMRNSVSKPGAGGSRL
jgi:hypothetical protein